MSILLKQNDALIEVNKLKDSSVDLFVIDPPYGNEYAHWDKCSEEFSKFTEKWVKLFAKKLKKNGTMWIFMSRNHLFKIDKSPNLGLINILEKYGNVNLNNWITWKRMKGRSSKKKPKSLAEEIIHFTKSDNYVWNEMVVLKEVVAPYVLNGRPRGWFTDESTGKRMRWNGLGNVWLYSSPVWSGKLDVQRHSAQKPLLLMERLVLLSSNHGDFVVDPFMGSGTTALISKYHNRNFLGVEKDKKIFKETDLYVRKHYKDIKEKLEKDIQKVKQ